MALFPQKGALGLLRRPSVSGRNQLSGSSGALSLPVLRSLTQKGCLGACRAKGFHLPGQQNIVMKARSSSKGFPGQKVRGTRGPEALGCFSQWSLCPPPLPYFLGPPLPLLACSSSLFWTLAPVCQILSLNPKEPCEMVSTPLSRGPCARSYDLLQAARKGHVFTLSNQCHLEVGRIPLFRSRQDPLGTITVARRGHGYGRDPK